MDSSGPGLLDHIYKVPTNCAPIFDMNWKFDSKHFEINQVQCLAEKLTVSLSRIRKAAVVFILDEL